MLVFALFGLTAVPLLIVVTRTDRHAPDPLGPLLTVREAAVQAALPIGERVVVPQVAESVPATDSVAELGSPAQLQDQFAQKYRGLSPKDLNRVASQVESEYMLERQQVLDRLRETRVVVESTIEPSGWAKLPPSVPKNDIYRMIISPEEVPKQPGDLKTIWTLHADPSAYPELYSLREEAKWLKGMSQVNR